MQAGVIRPRVESRLVKSAILKILMREPTVSVFRPVQRGAVTILMLHRFADAEYGNAGHSIEALRENLSFLRRNKYRLIGLPDLLAGGDEGGLASQPAVIFTVDDGYGDFVRVAAPVFAAFDCPVTVFITTGFVDGGLWMWWDQILWAFLQTRRSTVKLHVSGSTCEYIIDCTEARRRAADDLIERLKRAPELVMRTAVGDLLRDADVELPHCLPDMFRPMTWDDVSRCATQGVTFGPHTITHPILSQVSEQRAHAEMEGSWQRLRTATCAAIPVFCYPNGDYASFTDRDTRIAMSIGMGACVLAEQDFTSPHVSCGRREAIAELPRFAYPDDPVQFRQIVGGMERLKRRIRDRLRPPSPFSRRITRERARGGELPFLPQ